MALQISINTEYGIPATYWKITTCSINWLNKYCHVTLLGWSDKAAREAGRQYLALREFDWNGDKFPFIESEPQNEREISYAKIKEADEFKTASDA